MPHPAKILQAPFLSQFGLALFLVWSCLSSFLWLWQAAPDSGHSIFKLFFVFFFFGEEVLYGPPFLNGKTDFSPLSWMGCFQSLFPYQNWISSWHILFLILDHIGHFTLAVTPCLMFCNHNIFNYFYVGGLLKICIFFFLSLLYICSWNGREGGFTWTCFTVLTKST